MFQKSKRSFSIIESVPNALGFDDADLKANRNGVLSERQRRRVANQQSLLQITIACLSIIFVAFTLLGPLSLVRRSTSELKLITFGWIFAGFFLATAAYRYHGMRADSRDEQVSSISGVVRRRKEFRDRQKDVEVYFIYMDDLNFRFKVDEHVYDAFANRGLKNSYYTLYYLPRSKTILSAEPLENPVMSDTGSS